MFNQYLHLLGSVAIHSSRAETANREVGREQRDTWVSREETYMAGQVKIHNRAREAALLVSCLLL